MPIRRSRARTTTLEAAVAEGHAAAVAVEVEADRLERCRKRSHRHLDHAAADGTPRSRKRPRKSASEQVGIAAERPRRSTRVQGHTTAPTTASTNGGTVNWDEEFEAMLDDEADDDERDSAHVLSGRPSRTCFR